LLAGVGLQDAGRARFRDCQLNVFDFLDRKTEPVRDGRNREPRDCDPLGAPWNAQFDNAGDRFAHLERVQTSAFIAESSSSKIPKILTSPVMSKIFLICGLVQTRFTDPPCSRTRLRPPISTPRPVESI